MFAIYNNQIDASKSVLMIKYFGVFNYEFSDVKDLFGSIDIDDIVDRKIIDIDDKEYSELIEKINNLLNDELKGNDSTEGYDLPRCDYDCHIIEGNDNYQSAFVRVPEIKTTEQYDELKEYLKILSGYEIKYTPTPAHIVIGDYKFN